MYKLICMSFDGEYQTECQEFKSVDEAGAYSNELGSRWFFYPFHFIVTKSGKTIVEAPELLGKLKNKRVSTVAKLFNKISKRPDVQGYDPINYALTITYSL